MQKSKFKAALSPWWRKVAGIWLTMPSSNRLEFDTSHAPARKLFTEEQLAPMVDQINKLVGIHKHTHGKLPDAAG